jgi:hypothetical protein
VRSTIVISVSPHGVFSFPSLFFIRDSHTSQKIVMKFWGVKQGLFAFLQGGNCLSQKIVMKFWRVKRGLLSGLEGFAIIDFSKNFLE